MLLTLTLAVRSFNVQMPLSASHRTKAGSTPHQPHHRRAPNPKTPRETLLLTISSQQAVQCEERGKGCASRRGRLPRLVPTSAGGRCDGRLPVFAVVGKHLWECETV